MKSFFELCQCTENKLERELHENEIDFLQWVYDRYRTEPQNDKHKRNKESVENI